MAKAKTDKAAAPEQTAQSSQDQKNEVVTAEEPQALEQETGSCQDEKTHGGIIAPQEPAKADTEEQPAPEGENAPAAAPPAPDASDAPAAPEESDAAPLFSLDALAMEFRVPSWQQAALCRQQGWEKGKLVTHAEYQRALESLGSRRQGGGRL